MKKILALVLALCMVFALCACGSTSSSSTDSSAASAAESTSGDDAAASTVSADLTVGTGGESGTYYGYTGVLSTVVDRKPISTSTSSPPAAPRTTS